MRNRKILLTVGLVLVAYMTGCAPGLGRTIPTNRIPPVSLDSQAQSQLSNLRCRLGDFVDARDQSAIAEIDGRRLEPADDVSNSVKHALESELRAAGAALSLFDGPVISGEILEWKVKVTPKFPSSTIDSYATLRLKVLGPNAQAIYSAKYSGTFSEQHPLANEERVENVLAGAMAYALNEALNDKALVNEIRQQAQVNYESSPQPLTR